MRAESAWKLFRQDAARWVLPSAVVEESRVTFWQCLALLYRYRALQATLWFRIGSWFQHRRIPFLPGMIQRHIMKAYGLEIVVGTQIGGGLYLVHPVGTVITARRIGVNCSIIAAVTIGMRNKIEFPDIGDNVFIGAGARILGGIRVGDNAQIGANAVVIHDVPANATAVGVPARVLSGVRAGALEEKRNSW